MKKFFPVLTLIFLFSAFLFAQDPPPADDDDVVKITTTLIQIDVTVTDKKGNVIKDLKPEEVEIYENGKKQNVSNFSFINGVREQTVETPENPQPSNVPIPPTQVRPENVRRTISLVVDDLSLSFESTYFVKRALKKFVDEQMQDGDLVAIIRTGAGIGALQQFTTDKRQLYAAIEKVRWNPIGSGGVAAFEPIRPKMDDVLKQNAVITKKSADEESAPRDDEDFESMREGIFATGTLGAVNYIVRGMQDLPGRKSIMLFSDGFRLFDTVSIGGRGSKAVMKSSSRVMDSLTQLIDAANRASVVIYTMDARGLVYTGISAEDDLSYLTQERINEELSDRREKLFDTQDGLSFLARQTGGIAILNNNDLVGGVRRMLNDQSYYLIGYEPDDEVFDPQKRRFNKLDVKVTRPGMKVRYRSGFFGISDDQIAALPKNNLTPQQKVANALTSPFAVNDIPLRLNAVFGNDPKQGSFIRSFMHIDADNINFIDVPGGKKKAVFDILAVAFGDNGLAIDNINKKFTATVDEPTYQLVKEKGLIYDFFFPVKKPGAYQLRIAVFDTGSEKVGSANQFIEVANINKKRLMLSGIIVSNLIYKDWQNVVNGKEPENSANPVGDTAVRQFKAGTVLTYGAMIYNPKTAPNGKPDLTAQMKLFKDGKPVYEGKILPVSPENVIDPQRVSVSGSLNLGAEMQPGDYILQIVVTDNQAKKKRQTVSQFMPFEIIQ